VRETRKEETATITWWQRYCNVIEFYKMPTSPNEPPPQQLQGTVSTQVSLRPFVSGDDATNNWKKWERKFGYFALSTDLAKHSIAKARAILLQNVGDEALDVYFSLGIEETDSSPTYNDVLKSLGAYFAPKSNVTVKRYEFFTTFQKAGQPFDNFVTTLKKLALSCEFGSIKDDLVRDWIIVERA
jgi:hypothetical protein